MPVLLVHATEDFTDIFGISGGGGGLNTPNHPPRYATGRDEGEDPGKDGKRKQKDIFKCWE